MARDKNLTERAIQNMEKICRTFLDNQFELHLVNPAEVPDEVARFRIFQTPALVACYGNQAIKIVGDLSDTRAVVDQLHKLQSSGVSSVIEDDDEDPEQHLRKLRKLIQENEQSLAELRDVVADLESRRSHSRARHNGNLGHGGGNERAFPS